MSEPEPILSIKSLLYAKDKNIAGYLFLFGTLINYFIKMDSIKASPHISYGILFVIIVIAGLVYKL